MAETWVLNTRIDSTINETFSASFISAGNSYSQIEITSMFSQTWISYDSTNVYGNGSWTNEAYRTVVFDTAPSGYLFAWLQENGTKQSEPEPTIPKNACLIDGTGYSIKQGKPLIAGTAYTIKKGRVLIDGTGYDIDVSKKYTVTITGTIHVGYPEKSDGLGSYCKIGDDKYTTTGTVEAAQGTKIIVQAGSADVYGTFSQYTYIYLNGSIVAQGQSSPDFGIGAKYEFELNADVTIDFKSSTRNRIKYNTAYITT